MSEVGSTFALMSDSLICPKGCGDLDVFIARRGRRQRPYLGCITCGWAEWRGGMPFHDDRCGSDAGEDPPVDREVIDVVEGSDPYA